MKMNNGLIKYENSIFSKIKNFIFKIFRIDKKKSSEVCNDNCSAKENFKQLKKANIFLDTQLSDDIREKNRILQLKLLYDKGQLDADELSDEDVDKIVALYEEETEALNKDTKKRLEKIERVIKNNKNIS